MPDARGGAILSRHEIARHPDPLRAPPAASGPPRAHDLPQLRRGRRPGPL